MHKTALKNKFCGKAANDAANNTSERESIGTRRTKIFNIKIAAYKRVKNPQKKSLFFSAECKKSQSFEEYVFLFNQSSTRGT